MENVINLPVNRDGPADVVRNETEMAGREGGDVARLTGDQVVDADHLAAQLEEPRAEMGAQEPGAAGDDRAPGCEVA